MQVFIAPTANRELIAARVHAFILSAIPGKRLKITVQAYVKERTTPQCRWLNGVAYKALSDLTGYTRDEISDYCNGSFWGWKTVRCPKTPSNPKGVKDVPVRTTTKNERGERAVMTTLEFNDYKEFIQSFGAKVGCYIPDPQESQQEYQ